MFVICHFFERFAGEVPNLPNAKYKRDNGIVNKQELPFKNKRFGIQKILPFGDPAEFQYLQITILKVEG